MKRTEALTREGLVDQLVDRLLARILDGEWPIGHKIPNELMLAEHYRVGRNTIREAVSNLAKMGLLEKRQGQGTFVIGNSQLEGVVASALHDADLIQILEVRGPLEAQAARLAALRRTPAEAEEMRRLWEAQKDAMERGEDELQIEVDLKFHSMVVAATRNRTLIELYSGLERAVRESVRLLQAKRHASRHNSEVIQMHEALVEAIEQADPDAAWDVTTTYFGLSNTARAKSTEREQ